MAITVTLPISAPTGLNATLLSGGSLLPNTTYYYIVIAYDQQYFSAQNSSIFCYHSPISEEKNFTTDDTNKSVRINWNNVEGATRYQILLTTESGNYTNSGGYGTTLESVGNITNGVTGYIITSLSTEIYAFHTIQLVNELAGGIDKSLGLLKVYIDGGIYSTSARLNIYNAIVSAGFGEYVRWDGSRFILKGWLVTGGVSSGYMYFYSQTHIFIKGGVHCANPNYILQYGSFYSDLIGANYLNGCVIDLQNGRYPFRSIYPNVLKVYGSLLSFAKSYQLLLPEIKSYSYFMGGGACNFAYDLSGFADNILGQYVRSVTSVMKDLKVGIGNNWGNSNVYRLKVYANRSLPYSSIPTKFYACDFLTSERVTMYQPAAGDTYFCHFYDCNWKAYENNIPTFGFSIYPPMTVSNAYNLHHYSLSIKVTDKEGNTLSGVTLSMKDKDGNPATWIECANTFDKDVTGNEYTTDRITNETGEISYYLKSYRINHNHNYPSSDTTTNTHYIKTDYYPYTLTVSKDGFETYSTKIEFTEKVDWTIALIEEKPIIYYNERLDGEVIDNGIVGSITNNNIKGTIINNIINGSIT